MRPEPAPERAPLTYPQLGIWRTEQLAGGAALHNETGALRLSGPLDVAAIEAALAEVVAGHQVMRCAIEDGDPEPGLVFHPAVTVPVRVLQVPAGTDPARLLGRLAALPLDLGRAPLLRAHLVRLTAREHVLLVVAHHIIADAWSLGGFLDELGARYTARLTGAAAPRLAGGPDFGAHARAERAAGDDPAQVAYWRDRLAGDPPVTTLPPDRPHPARTDHAGAVHEFTLPAPLVAATGALARRERVSTAATVLAAFTALVHRYTGQRDVVVGLTAATRGRPGLAGVFGPLLNLLPCRTGVDPDAPFRSLLAATRDTVKGALRHKELPFARMVELFGGGTAGDRAPLFRLLVSIHNGRSGQLTLPLVAAERVPVHSGTAKYDLTLILQPLPDGALRGLLEYRASTYTAATAVRFAEGLSVLLAAAVEDPDLPVGDLPVLGSADRERLLVGFNDPGAHVSPSWTLSDVVRRNAERSPERIAVRCAGTALDYRELDRAADVIAGALAVRPGDRVAIAVSRRAEVVPLLLGVWRAGAVAVPMGAELPAARAEAVVADSGAALVVTDADLPVLMAGPRVACDRVDPSAPAYLLYTSGSTGRPKGVTVPHRALANLLSALVAEPGLASSDTVLSVTALSFDMSMVELCAPLVVGATVEIVPDSATRDGAALADVLAASGATVLQATPSTWRLLLDSGWAGDPRLRAFAGGEALEPRLVEELLARTAELWNLYGPTEVTVYATGERVLPGEPITIGRPLAGAYCHVLDQRGRPVPLGAIGELVVGGPGVALGYWRAPALTAGSFVDDPVRPGEGRTVYRTGDLAGYLPDGRIVLHGRLDHQVKIRGHRVEPGEVEAALTTLPGVRQAVVQADGDPVRLVAFLVLDPEVGFDPGELRAALRTRLPEVMVPSAVAVLPEIPLTSGGKLDRIALRALAGSAVAPAPGGRAPATRTEHVLATLCAEVLGLPEGSVGVTDDFFDLGGSSLTVSRFVARVRHALDVPLQLSEFVGAPTLADLARLVDARQAETSPRRPAALARPPGTPSDQQRQLWLMDRLHPGSAVYHLPASVRLRGELDVAALALAVRDLLIRHPVLRSTSAVTGDGLEVRVGPVPDTRLPVVDLAGLPPERAEGVAAALTAHEIRRPFDLSRSPLLRALLIRLSAAEHVLVVTAHHTALDGWSVPIALADLAACYRHRTGMAGPPPDPGPGYAEHTTDGDDTAHWREVLRGHPGVLDLPTDRPRPPVRDLAGANLPVVLAADRVRAFAAESGATPFTVLLAAYAALLGRYAGSEDVVVGVPVANREDPAFDRAVGCFTTTLPLRVDLSGDPSLAELTGRVRATLLAGLDHPRAALDLLGAELDLSRDPSRPPLVQAAFVYQERPFPPLLLTGRAAEVRALTTGTAKYELGLTLVDEGDRFAGDLEYPTGLFDESTAVRFAEQLAVLLAESTTAPDRPLSAARLSDVDPAPIEPAGADRARYPTPVAELFRRQALARPDAVALRHAGEVLTYGELAAWAHGVAGAVRATRSAAGGIVAVLLPVGAAQVAAALGVLAAGHPFLVLDTDDESPRTAGLLADAEPVCVVTTARLAEARSAVLAGLPVADPGAPEPGAPAPADPWPGRGEDPLCLVYTSGSTGVPKGVLLSNATFAQFANWQAGCVEVGPDSRIAQWAPFTYDAAYTEVFLALLRGATLCLPPRAARRDPVAMTAWLHAERITHFETVPSFFALVTEVFDGGAGVPPELAHVQLSGEVLPEALARRWRGPLPPLVHNQYGPTECVLATHHRLTATDTAGPVPIGTAIAGREVLVLDDRLRSCPDGVPGRLYVRSDHLAGAYHRRRADTAAAYVPDPWRPGGTLYHTGDLGRRRDGVLEFLGRSDLQLKIRGNRVEPAGVEALLADHPDVREAVVTAHDGGGPAPVLVGYVVPASGRTPDPAALRAHLAARLPSPSVPDVVLVLDDLPRTRSNKVDYRNLPAPGARPVGGQAERPRTGAEEVVARAWRDVLGLDRVGRDTNFFDAGGNSLLAARLQLLLIERLGRPVRLVDVFAHPTIAELTARVLATGPRAPEQDGARADRRRAALRSLSRARGGVRRTDDDGEVHSGR
ncbi:non-ribosomal peptide synthetase [Saccharothrix espanaensis]|uniref:Non-ribosomal peptide synthetase n=1 Tax=Saccharothrix espanaensis (strain ATCC 51144 / DSM 44229 / JCM 9112 / NBRC 15066 / NRRL 15764) TaxID=1179773 RepID=K0JY92_SACES|nr:non-ribosomal peptide synthetase [Saccharothrix espanaensis]CCH32920.1 Non-ribosomal peptide synthetase [Saccharothrix espanaensis DSM 44229]